MSAQAASPLPVEPTRRPPLDPGFLPAVLWNRAYAERVSACGGGQPLFLSLARPDGVCFVHEARILPHEGEHRALNLRFAERLVKFLLWQKGGSRLHVAGCDALARSLADIYSPSGSRSFDVEVAGRKMFLEPLTVEAAVPEAMPEARAPAVALGRHLEGCRIGFDLGGSDRKAAAVIDGRVVFSEEIPWNPYFERDPGYHLDGIQDSLQRAAAHLPRVDAIGGSAAGVYVNNEVRVASLFRGVSDRDFERVVRRLFLDLRARWNNVPFEVVNDGEVTALAGSMSLQDNAVLGLSMGTSQAAGYCDGGGRITAWLNELAFAPVDYRPNAPVDEWSGDAGCGVQYFSQQAVARLVPASGIEMPADTPFSEQLEAVQERMRGGDPRARAIYETIGVYFGYGIAHYAAFYDLRNLLVLGRVTSGDGGQVILDTAADVLRAEFPELAEAVSISTPDETAKRHGQAIAAASLPALPASNPA